MNKEELKVIRKNEDKERDKDEESEQKETVDTSEDEVDGCDIEMNAEDATQDEELPAAEGGVA